MNSIFKFILTSFLFVVCQSNLNQAIAKIDECREFKREIEEASAELLLSNEPYKDIDSFGVEFDRFEGSYPIIYYVYPDLFLGPELEVDVRDIHQAEILEINDQPVNELSNTQIKDARNQSEIKLKLSTLDKPLLLEKKSFPINEILVTTNFEILSNIDTKNSKFDAVFKIRYYWVDSRLASLAKKISASDKDLSEYGFYCVLNQKFVQEHLYPLPALIPKYFKNSQQVETSPLLFDFFPPEIGCGEGARNPCNSEQKETGIGALSYSKTFNGTQRKAFELSSFPFDGHYLQIVLAQEEELPQDLLLTRNYLIDERDSGRLKANLEELKWNSQEWNMNELESGFDYFWYSELDMHLPVIVYSAFVDRIPNYYILKILLPICFILIVTWSVFWIRAKDIESRLTVSIVSFLTLIAYNFVIQKELPTLGYLTLMDSHILLAYLFAGMPTLITVASKRLLDNGSVSLSDKLDRFFRIAYLPLFIVMFLCIDLYY